MTVILPSKMDDMRSIIRVSGTFTACSLTHAGASPPPPTLIIGTFVPGIYVPPSAGISMILDPHLLDVDSGSIVVAAMDRTNVSPGWKRKPMGHRPMSTGTISPGRRSSSLRWRCHGSYSVERTGSVARWDTRRRPAAAMPKLRARYTLLLGSRLAMATVSSYEDC
jgi:hypothetical protein